MRIIIDQETIPEWNIPEVLAVVAEQRKQSWFVVRVAAAAVADTIQSQAKAQ